MDTMKTQRIQTIAVPATQAHEPGNGSAAASPAERVPDLFASNVFTIERMRQRLPRGVFEALIGAMRRGMPLAAPVADVVANAMKDWAIEKGATHYCHWFQPMTGLTAEKHDSFISPTPEGDVRMEFSGKALVRGEPDASSFPSGGLREGFEARGYTVWDCTSPVFVKEDGSHRTLFIPSAFCSYTGKALDNKTPLLRSIEAIDRHALRVLRALGDDRANRVISMLGVEQEYFLVDAELADKRLDLAMTGRTLFGANTPKGMAMSVHYFGSIHERIASFMNEVNTELWTLGVLAKTQHNEISPCQFEIAPVYGPANVATDHNHLTMEALQKIAERHGLTCLIHDKPFAGFGGSGKHHNWSLMTDMGDNLLDPGHTPHENELFLVFLCAVIQAVDKYAHLLRASVASAGNDHRLGAMEAPPAIISIFLGDQLWNVLECLEADTEVRPGALEPIRLGVSTLPPLPKDATDRNRTSPFAFTGDRFEFRTPGSALSPAKCVFVLNTIVADALAGIADELEAADDANEAAQGIVRRLIHDHKRVIFNGDNYTPQWLAEAEKRGLANLRDTVDADGALGSGAVVARLERQRVVGRGPLGARVEINFQLYAQSMQIEGRCAATMARRQILPRAMTYAGQLAEAASRIQQAGAICEAHCSALSEICGHIDRLREAVERLERAVADNEKIEDAAQRARAARDTILPALQEVREPADSLEGIVDADLWPIPTYDRLLSLA